MIKIHSQIFNHMKNGTNRTLNSHFVPSAYARITGGSDRQTLQVFPCRLHQVNQEEIFSDISVIFDICSVILYCI